MTLSLPAAAFGRRYVRAPAPLFFPVEAQVPETETHRLLVNFLFAIFRQAFGDQALVSCDQFVYWDPTDPTQCLAPDIGFRRGKRSRERLRTWKTWLLGAPELAVEIASHSDEGEPALDDKLRRYRQAGILEVVRFDPEDAERPLRLWDLFDGDLVERELGRPEALLCDALGVYWCIAVDPELGPVLRLARDAAGGSLLPTPEEAERARTEAERAAREAERAAKDTALAERDEARARLAELEAELRKR
jgi:Uma2 family endonuclease